MQARACSQGVTSIARFPPAFPEKIDESFLRADTSAISLTRSFGRGKLSKVKRQTCPSSQKSNATRTRESDNREIKHVTMSTSSGRAKEGNCSRCGHSMEQHQKLQFTKCKKCRRSFEVCQAGIHGNDGVGWRICYVPCSCGEKYYPLGLSRAHELAPHEYQTKHVAYRPLTPDVDETIDEPGLDEVTEYFDNMGIGDSGPSSSSAGGHVRVDSGGTDELAWDQSAVKTGAHAQPWSRWVWEEDNSRYYRSRAGEFGEWEYEYDYKTPGPEIGKGKGKRESGGSEDELA
ncbi:hypothetical protein G7Y89_g1864 [Cudoniella acicularis]|uniref:Uncharacterized protein n=1 Tax=Cudoniella acicularis TaxID=354080 RepID=A0A8H4RVJ2_9HELO|nr:hypothetical protein G7Y89_g1864 [Cudoniella acicularis]